jgi:4'-phosphopantetheinyl transferase
VTASQCGWPPAPDRVAPAADEIHVWSASLARPAEEVAALARTLSDDERERAAAMRHAATQAEFIVARGLLRSLLGGCLDVWPSRIRFSRAPQGKPQLAEPGHLYFNVSHSHGVGLFAVARRIEVGVDLERLRPFSDELGLAERYFTPREAAALRALPPAARLEAFFRLWTRKEAYLKAHGLGISYGLERVEVSHGPDEPARILLIDGDEREAARWSLRALAPAAGYVGALACQAHDYRLFCWRLPDAPRGE